MFVCLFVCFCCCWLRTSSRQSCWPWAGIWKEERLEPTFRKVRVLVFFVYSSLRLFVCFSCLLVGCLKYQKHASASQGRICPGNFTCYHTEIEVADRTFHLIQSQYTDTRPTSPSTDTVTPGAWQSSGWSTNFLVSGMTRPRENPTASGIRTPELPLSR